MLKDELNELKHRRHELRKKIKADIMCVWSSINNLRHTQARTKTVLLLSYEHMDKGLQAKDE